MWCKNNNCGHYDKEGNKCTRKGTDNDNRDKIGICCMEKSEGEY